MLETIKKLVSWLKGYPLLIRIVLLFAAATIVVLMSLSCGVTRAVVHNGANGTSTEIKITTNNPTSVTASPNVNLYYDPEKPEKQ